MRVGVDTGGTFTDTVADDGRVLKVPSTPADPSAAVAGRSSRGSVTRNGHARILHPLSLRQRFTLAR